MVAVVGETVVGAAVSTLHNAVVISDTSVARSLKSATVNTKLTLLVMSISSARSDALELPTCSARMVTPAFRRSSASATAAVALFDTPSDMSTANLGTPSLAGRIPLATVNTSVRRRANASAVSVVPPVPGIAAMMSRILSVLVPCGEKKALVVAALEYDTMATRVSFASGPNGNSRNRARTNPRI